MFGIDRWLEIFETIRKNKLRTFLTALSVAWGIFMLVVLLGVGVGMQRKVEENFKDDAVNSIWVSPGRTTIPHKGHAVGRRLQFTNADHDITEATLPGVEHITSRFHINGEYTTTYKSRHASFDVRATHPAHQYLEKTIITEGRFLHELDLAERRKVAVIGVEVAATLFRDEPPLGKYINIAGIQYRVIGVFRDEGGEGELRKIYVPITTAQMAYGDPTRIDRFMFTVGDATPDEARAIENELRAQLAARHDFAPQDRRAVWLRNNLEWQERALETFRSIELFIWIIGFGTILAGVVGVSNIMMISVKERTKEIGVRKALGAPPWSIISQIMQEALLITGVAGYFGLVSGVFVVEAIRTALPQNEYITAPEVDLTIAFVATGTLMIAGMLSGFFPARRAAKVNPVVALRDE